MSARGLAVVVSAAMVAVGASLVPAPMSAAAAPACFPETAHCIQGRFLDYWTAHGGLAINGYPLTDEVQQRLEDGNIYTVQYFERVRLEWHPENQAPYDVLLGQFGRLIHPADPPAARRAGATYFDKTGHNVAPDFAAYWQAHGGLDQFGFPLTEEIQERLDDGRTYTVQYFERARFERHPENAAPYDIELGQFGRRILAGLPYKVAVSVSNAHPVQNSSVTVTATLTKDGRGVSGATMTTTWHYKTTTNSCSGGPSGADGVISCALPIGQATSGYAVEIDILVTYQGQTFTATTSFTPR
ncbi:MAG TPA: hypothetical protein VFW96_05535 [Thermomicrobiales bacterium]|nr:hypothetical protein [Thermomicrobiales bacterium]